jgi:hypothetical protein
MPGPALPAWVAWVAGSVVVAIGSLITFFVTSSKAKARAAEYKKKVLRIIEALKMRLDLLEEALRHARTAQEKAEQRAQEAEEAARRDAADARAAGEEAQRARDAADRSANAVVELARHLAKAQAELQKWRREAEVADELGNVAGHGVTFAAVSTSLFVHKNSVLLGGAIPRPEQALRELDSTLRLVEGGNQVIAELVARVHGGGGETEPRE